jgi:hypothetical protein
VHISCLAAWETGGIGRVFSVLPITAGRRPLGRRLCAAGISALAVHSAFSAHIAEAAGISCIAPLAGTPGVTAEITGVSVMHDLSGSIRSGGADRD